MSVIFLAGGEEVLVSKIQCPDGTILCSRHQHDFVEHTQADGKYYALDGGVSYQRIVSTVQDYENLSVYTWDNYSTIRSTMEWGKSYDKDGNYLGSVEYIKLMDLEDDHLLAVGELTAKVPSSKIARVIKHEISYRELNK